jgi:hypothetical protein
MLRNCLDTFFSQLKMLIVNANVGSRIMGMSEVKVIAPLSYFSLVAQSNNILSAFGGQMRHTGNDLHEQELFDLGGREGDIVVSNALYTTKSGSMDEWSLVTVPGTRPPSEYWGQGLAKVVEGLFVLLGGHQDNRAHSNLWLYQSKTGSWEQQTYHVLKVAQDGAAAVPVQGCTDVMACQGVQLARFGHTVSPYSGERVTNLRRGSGIVVVFGGVDSLSGLPFDDVTLAYITPLVEYPNKVYFSLANTGGTSPGGLGYHTAAVFDDMLLVYGGLRKMKYDSSNQLWAFVFGQANAILGIPLSGKWSQVALTAGDRPFMYAHDMSIQTTVSGTHLWIVGGSMCVPGPDDEVTVCQDEAKFEGLQVIKDMTTVYKISFQMDGTDYILNEIGAITGSMETVPLLTGEDVEVPVPRISTAASLYGDILILFGGASENAARTSEYGWGDLNDLWSCRIGHKDLARRRWRVADVPGNTKALARSTAGMIQDGNFLWIYGGANLLTGEQADMWYVKITSASAFRSSNNNPGYAIANLDSSFIITAQTLFNTPVPDCSSDFAVEFLSLDSSSFISGVIEKKQQEGSCQYIVNYKIRTIGVFRLTITTMGQSISGSPSEFVVRPGLTNHGMSTAIGKELTGCMGGLTCTFTILSRDVSGNQGKGEDDVRVILTGPCNEPLEDPITGLLRTCKGPDTVTAVHTNFKDGSFGVTYTITATGNYSIHVRFSGSDAHIGGSPFLSLISANEIAPHLSWVYGPGLTFSQAGLSSKFFVQVCIQTLKSTACFSI